MRALDGIRVVDFGQHLAPSLAAMILADHGADVVRVDPPRAPVDTDAHAVVATGQAQHRTRSEAADDMRLPGDWWSAPMS